MSPHRFWEVLRDEQDRGRVEGRYLAYAKARGVVPPGRRHGARWPLAIAIPALAAVSLAILFWRAHTGRALVFTAPDGEPGQTGTWIAAPSEGPSWVRFSDGSLLSLSPGSRMRVTALDAQGARLVLERGAASASVVHRATSHWVVDVGPFQVAVVGTRFDVSWDSNEEVFLLSLRDGSVVVSGACIPAPRAVTRGHRIRVSCKRGNDEIVETGADDQGPDAGQPLPPSAPDATSSRKAADDAFPSPTPQMDGVRVDSPSYTTQASALSSNAWHALVAAGRYRDALDLVEHRGFTEECRRAGGADLLELGDAARYSGDASEARLAYQAARGKLPGGGRSAYALGLLAFDRERDFTGAAGWFRTYLAEQPNGNLRQEAAGRAMEAWQRAGAHDKAKDAALEYLRQYPRGAQAPMARQLANGP